MRPRRYQIAVSDVVIDVVHKNVKNINLAVYPQEGRVRISAPLMLNQEAVQRFAMSRLSWIRNTQAGYQEEIRQSQREYVSGEQHYVFGKPCELNIVRYQGAGKVIQRDMSTIDLHVRETASAVYRERVMEEWYRAQLKQRIPELVEHWQPVIGVQVNEWRVKKMKTRWGSCNIRARRIWLNLELARTSRHCLEYVVVHEMVHLLERRHNDRFKAYMDQFLPNWRLYRKELKLPH